MSNILTSIRSLFLSGAYVLDNMGAWATGDWISFLLVGLPIFICSVLALSCFLHASVSSHVAHSYHWDR
jgi:hypothetical protein